MATSKASRPAAFVVTVASSLQSNFIAKTKAGHLKRYAGISNIVISKIPLV